MSANSESAKPRLIHVICALLTVYIVWGSTYLALKYAIVGLPPFILVGLRNLLAAAILFPFAWKALRAHPVRLHASAALITGLLLVVCGNGSVTYAQSHGVPSAIAALVVGLVPSWMTVFGLFGQGKSKQTRRSLLIKTLGLIAGLCGLAILVADGSLTPTDGSWTMTVVLVFGTMTWAYGSVRSKHLQSHPDLFASTTLSMAAGGIIALGVGWVLGESIPVDAHLITTKAIWSFAYLVVFGSVIAFSAYGWLLKHADPTVTGTYAYVNPLIAIVLGYFVGGEKLSTSVFAAGALIIVSIVIITTAGKVDARLRMRELEKSPIA
jgi:drug/metabolite transporter (DMT)-like permease